MAKRRFYGISGTNGYGVFDDYNKVLEQKPYIRGFKIKGFRYYNEAESYAINTFKQLVYGKSDAIKVHEIRRINRFYHGSFSRKQIRRNSFFDTHAINNNSASKPLICPFSIGI